MLSGSSHSFLFQHFLLMCYQLSKGVLIYECLPLTGAYKLWEGQTWHSEHPSSRQTPPLPSPMDEHMPYIRAEIRKSETHAEDPLNPSAVCLPIHHCCMHGPRLFQKSNFSFLSYKFKIKLCLGLILVTNTFLFNRHHA